MLLWKVLTNEKANSWCKAQKIDNTYFLSVKPPMKNTDHRQRAKKAFISTIKSTIESKTSLKLLLVYNEESKQMKRSLLLSNQMDRSKDSNQLTIKAWTAELNGLNSARTILNKSYVNRGHSMLGCVSTSNDSIHIVDIFDIRIHLEIACQNQFPPL